MQTNQSTTFSSCDILVIDNDIANDNNIAKDLSFKSSVDEAGIKKKLLSFSSGEKGLNHLNSISRSGYPSLIVVDFLMPLINGREILRYLKYTYRYARIPVVVHSAKMNESMKLDLREMGAVACFKKTFSREEFKTYLEVVAAIFATKTYS